MTKPIWTDGRRTIYRGDSRKLCATLSAESFDALVTDPPFGEGRSEGDASPVEAAKLLTDVLQAARQALKPGAHVAYFWSNRSLDLAIDAGRAVGLEYKRLLGMRVQQSGARPYRGWLPKTTPIVLMKVPGRAVPAWRERQAARIARAMKAQGLTRYSIAKRMEVSERLVMKWSTPRDQAWSYPNDRHRRKLEAILGIEIPPAEPEEHYEARGDIYEVTGAGPRGPHPCEKPLEVVEDIIRRLGSSVLDPFAGSGTTLVAAQNLGVRAVGIEIDAAHCKAAKRRLNENH